MVGAEGVRSVGGDGGRGAVSLGGLAGALFVLRDGIDLDAGLVIDKFEDGGAYFHAYAASNASVRVYADFQSGLR